MAEFDPATFASLEPKEFAQLVKSTPDATLKEVLQSDLRGKILDEIFSRMPGLFRPDRAGSTNAVIHWSVGDRPDGGADTYELVIADGKCALSPTPDNDPKLTLSLGSVEFLKIVTGSGNPVGMFMTGKLKAKGDLGLAANVANLFDIPKA
jgi:putative sterol carrier protein